MNADTFYIRQTPCARCASRYPEEEAYAAEYTHEPFLYGCYRAFSTAHPCGRTESTAELSILAGELAEPIRRVENWRLREEVCNGVTQVLARAMEDVGAELDAEAFRYACNVSGK